MGGGRGNALVKQLRPVVRSDLIQGLDEVLKGIGHNLRWATLPSMKATAEIVQRPLALRLLTDDGINLQPDQFSLGIVVQAAPPSLPLRSHHA